MADGGEYSGMEGHEDTSPSLWIPLLISFFAGISTGLGGFVVVCWGVPSVRVVGIMEALAAGVMLYLSTFEMLLPAAHQSGWLGCLLSLGCGCVICWLMEQIPTPPSWQAFVKAESKGAGETWCNLDGGDALEAGETVSIMEAATNRQQMKLVKREKLLTTTLETDVIGPNGTGVHPQGDVSIPEQVDALKEKDKDKEKQNEEELEFERHEKLEERSIDVESRGKMNLIQVAIVTCLAISLHNFPEGIAVYLTSLRNIDLGLSLAIGITLHNIPEGLSVGAPVYYVTKSKMMAILVPFVSGMFEPLGAVLGGLLLSKLMTNYVLQLVMAGVAGVMIYLSLTELIPTAYKYCGTQQMLMAVGLGTLLTFAMDMLLIVT